MSWILIKIVSDLLSAGNVVVAKEMLSHHVPDRRLYLFNVAIVSIPFAALGLFYLANLTSFLHLLVALLIGVSYIIAGHFYYLAMSAGQPSRLSLIARVGPMLTLILSALILNESLTTAQYIGFGFSFLGGLVLVIERSKGTFRSSDGTWHALVSTIAVALSSTFTVYLLQRYSLWETFTMTRVGVVFGTLALLGPRGTWNTGLAILDLRIPYSGTLLGEQVIRLVSLFLSTIAIAQIGSATLVGVLSGFTPFYVWLIAIAVGHETIRDHKLRTRFLALSMLLVSSYTIAQ